MGSPDPAAFAFLWVFAKGKQMDADVVARILGAAVVGIVLVGGFFLLRWLFDVVCRHGGVDKYVLGKKESSDSNDKDNDSKDSQDK